MTAVTIRRATLDDLDAVLALYLASGLDTALDRAASARVWPQIERVGGEVWLAESADGRALGTLTWFVLPLLAHGAQPEALVEDVAVHPEAQGRGIGRALMARAMALARDRGCYKLALSSNARRREAHAFYERLGFQQHGWSFMVSLADARDGVVA